MPTLTDYRGLQVVTPDPTGEGGLAIQNDLKSIVDWSPKSVWSESTSPTVNDDAGDNFYPGSLWLRTNTTPPQLYVCQSSVAGAAVWLPVLLALSQDSAPKLGGDLDVNGKKIIGSVVIGSTSGDTLTINGGSATIPNGLTFTKTAQTGVAESIYSWRISDDPNSSLSIANGTSNAGTFAPKFQGVQDGTAVALNFNGQSTAGNDSGASPYILFIYQNANSDVATRPGVEFRNRATTAVQFTAGYNIRLAGPDTSPTLAGITKDSVSLAPVDNGIDNRELQIQPEAGMVWAVGNSQVRRIKSATQEHDQILASVNTTDATQTTAAAIAITSGNTYLIQATIVARRIGGSSGAAEDGASYVRRGTYTTKSGTVTLMGSVQTIGTDAEDQAGWDATLDVNGSNVRVRVTGAANNNVTWLADVSVQRVAS